MARPFAAAAMALLFSAWPFAAAVGGESFGSRRFEVCGKAIVVETLLSSEKRGRRSKKIERVSLKAVASALGGTATALDGRGSFVLELAGTSVAFSSEYPAIVRAGDRLVSLSSDARALLGDLYLPSDFMKRVVEPIVASPSPVAPDSGRGVGDRALEAGSNASETTVGKLPGGAAESEPAPMTVGAASRASRADQRRKGPSEDLTASSATLDAESRVAPSPVASPDVSLGGFPSASAVAPSPASATVAPVAVTVAPAAAAAPSSAAPSAASPGEPSRTIVLDPGHGGDESGAAGKSGLLEKEITLDVAKRLKALLERRPGVRAFLTRDADTKVTLDERASLANHLHADLFVSIHVNASRGRNARGAETFFLASQAKDEESRTLAAMENNAAGVDPSSIGQDSGDLAMVLWDLAQTRYLEESSDLAEVIQKELNAELDLRNRGIKQAPFRVLMGATMPAVLVEIGFISNPAEETALKTDQYRDRIAQALSRAVLAFRAAPGARASTNR